MWPSHHPLVTRCRMTSRLFATTSPAALSTYHAGAPRTSLILQLRHYEASWWKAQTHKWPRQHTLHSKFLPKTNCNLFFLCYILIITYQVFHVKQEKMSIGGPRFHHLVSDHSCSPMLTKPIAIFQKTWTEMIHLIWRLYWTAYNRCSPAVTTVIAIRRKRQRQTMNDLWHHR